MIFDRIKDIALLYDILFQKDNNGNNILHAATIGSKNNDTGMSNEYTKKVEMILTKMNMVAHNKGSFKFLFCSKNNEGKTAYDLAEEYSKRKIETFAQRYNITLISKGDISSDLKTARDNLTDMKVKIEEMFNYYKAHEEDNLYNTEYKLGSNHDK